MRIAILPVEREYLKKNNEFVSSTDIAYIMSYLEINFPDDLIFPACDPDLLFRAAADFVCIYVPHSDTFNSAVELMNIIKEKMDLPIVMMGNHISYLPKTLPIQANAGIIGEGEEALRQLIELFKSNNLNEKAMAKIPGIVFHSKNQKVVTEKARFIDNLDNLPLTRRFFYKMPGNWLPGIITGRGNPCKNIYTPGDVPIRLHSAERMVGDIVDIMTYYPETKVVPVMDYLFLHDLNRFKKFVEIVEETKLTGYVKLIINAKAYQLNEDVLYLLRYVLDIPQLNIDFVSPSEKNQKELKEPLMTIKQHQEILENCYKYNINTELSFSIGAPNETKEEATRNYWTVRNQYLKKYQEYKCKTELLMPVPGTELWQKAVVKKLIGEGFNFDNLDIDNLNAKTPILANIAFEDIKLIKQSYLEINKFEKKVSFLEDFHHKKNQKFSNQMQEIIDVTMQNVILDEALFRSYVHPEPKNISTYDKNASLTIMETLEQYVRSKEDSGLLMNLMYEGYNKYLKKAGDIINYDKEMLDIVAIPVLEQMVKIPDISKVLQIVSPSVIDLKRIFYEDRLEIDTLSPEVFNIINYKKLPDKKYDIIILFFTLDTIARPDKLLKYCNSILNENGHLIITFFNIKSIYSLHQLINNISINSFFHGLGRLNMYSKESMAKLIAKNDFILTNLEAVEFPQKHNALFLQKMTAGAFRSFYKNVNDFYDLSYTFLCKKK